MVSPLATISPEFVRPLQDVASGADPSAASLTEEEAASIDGFAAEFVAVAVDLAGVAPRRTPAQLLKAVDADSGRVRKESPAITSPAAALLLTAEPGPVDTIAYDGRTAAAFEAPVSLISAEEAPRQPLTAPAGAALLAGEAATPIDEAAQGAGPRGEIVLRASAATSELGLAIAAPQSDFQSLQPAPEDIRRSDDAPLASISRTIEAPTADARSPSPVFAALDATALSSPETRGDDPRRIEVETREAPDRGSALRTLFADRIAATGENVEARGVIAAREVDQAAPSLVAGDAAARGLRFEAASPLAPSPAPAQAPASPAEQLVAAIRADAGGDSFEIRLDPPELGRVKIHFAMERSDVVVATLSSERSDTLDLMRRSAADLVRELARAGLENVRLEFSAHGGGDSPARTSSQEAIRNYADFEAGDDARLVYVKRRDDGRLDRLV